MKKIATLGTFVVMVLAALTTSELIRYSVAILTLAGLFVFRAFRVKISEIFKAVSEERDFLLKENTHLEVVQNGITGELALLNPGTRHVKMFILARSRNKTPFEIRIRRATFKNKFDTLINAQIVSTGDPEFDREFIISSNDENTALSFLDEHMRSDLVNNKTFLDSPITFDDSCMYMKFIPHIRKKSHLENYVEVMLFLVHMVERLDRLQQRK